LAVAIGNAVAEGIGRYWKKTGGGHALKIIISGSLSEWKVYDTPLAPLGEGSRADGAAREL